jgi:hypothetical protein
MRLNSGNACYHSVQNLLSSRLLSKNLNFNIHKTISLPVVLYRCKTWSLTFTPECSSLPVKAVNTVHTVRCDFRKCFLFCCTLTLITKIGVESGGSYFNLRKITDRKILYTSRTSCTNERSILGFFFFYLLFLLNAYLSEYQSINSTTVK